MDTDHHLLHHFLHLFWGLEVAGIAKVGVVVLVWGSVVSGIVGVDVVVVELVWRLEVGGVYGIYFGFHHLLQLFWGSEVGGG